MGSSLQSRPVGKPWLRIHASPRADQLLVAVRRLVSRHSVLEPSVGVLWALGFARACGADVPVSRYALLFAGLWLVYMADRWLDTRRPGATLPQTERHRFAHQHHRGLAMTWLVVLVASLGLASVVLTAAEWRGGLLVVLGSSAYLGLVHRLGSTRWNLRTRGAKELGVALLFSSGTTLFLWSNATYTPALLVANTLFGILVLQNLLLLATLERQIDFRHNTPSAAWNNARIGNAHRIVGAALSCVALLVSVLFPGVTPQLSALLLGVGVSALLLLLLQQSHWMSTETRHVLSDAAVLAGALPALVSALS